VETGGHLAIRAESIALEAASGKLQMRATDDVVVRGRSIRLN
jgi:hypothetical protein